MEDRSHLPEEFRDWLAQGIMIGALLRGERMTRGLSTRDVYDHLKIRPALIEAIENHDLSAFNSTEYLPGYIRAYAKLLDLEPKTVLGLFAEQSGLKMQTSHSFDLSRHGTADKARPNSIVGNYYQRERGPLDHALAFIWGTTQLIPAASLIAVIGVIGYGGVTMISDIQTLTIEPSSERPLVDTDVAARLASQAPDLSTNGQVANIDYAALYERQALETPVLTPRVERIADLKPENIGVLPAPSNTPTSTETSAVNLAAVDLIDENARPEPVVSMGPALPEVDLISTSPAWVRITNDAGETLFEQTLAAGETYSVPFTDGSPVLRAGNATSVYLRIDGELHGPVGGAGRSVVSEVSLLPESIEAEFARAENIENEVQDIETAYLATQQGGEVESGN